MIRRSIYQALEHISHNIIVPIFCGRMRGKMWLPSSGLIRFWLGNFERAESMLFARTVSCGSIVFDIGANVGFYTLLASELAGPDGKVYAFEPIERNLFYLYAHLRINRCMNVTVLGVAVSNQSGYGFLKCTGRASTNWKLAADGGVRVRTAALDDLVFKEKTCPLPDYIKIDVEGAEMLALSGAKRILIEKKPVIFLSMHTPSLRNDCIRLLKDLGYSLWPIGCPRLEECGDLLALAKVNKNNGY